MVNPAVRVTQVRQLPVGSPAVRVDGGAHGDVCLDDWPEHPLGPLVARADHHEAQAGHPHDSAKHPHSPSLGGVPLAKFHLPAHCLINLTDILIFFSAQHFLVIFVVFDTYVHEVFVPFGNGHAGHEVVHVTGVGGKAGRVLNLFVCLPPVSKHPDEHHESL